MERETIIKKAMHRLISGSIQKELQDYIKTDASEVFNESDDVKLSGRVRWDKSEEDADLEDIEIESASIGGFAHYLLHDLYEGKIPEKNERVVDAEKLYKEFVGKSFPFKSSLDDHDLSGEIKILEAKYNAAKDEVIITKHTLENIQVDH